MTRLPDATGLVVAYDTETTGLHTSAGARIVSLSAAWRDPASQRLEAITVPFDMGWDHSQWLGPKPLPSNHLKRLARLRKLHGGVAWSVVNRSRADYERLMGWLAAQRLVMHHAKFDCLITSAGPRDHPELGTDLMPGVIWDTQTAQSVIGAVEFVRTSNPGARSTSLKPTSVRYGLGRELGIEGREDAEQEALGPWKGPKEDPRYDLIPWSVLGPYSVQDAQLTYLLWEFQQEWLEGQADGAKLRAQIRTERDLTRVLYAMEQRGVRLDLDGIAAQGRNLAKLVAEARDRVPFRPTPPGAQKWFFGSPAEGGLGHLPYNDKLTKTRRPQVDEEVVARLAKEGIQGAEEYQKMAELKAAGEKWYDAWPRLAGPDGRLHTCYRQATVVSGRLSAEWWQSQALPHDYQIPEGLTPPRAFLTEDEPYELWEVDLSQAEIRVATAIAKCGPMLRAFRAGADSHDAACKLMFYPHQKLSEAKLDAGFKRLRDVAKRCNLGILYGAGAVEIRKQILKFTGIDYDQDMVRGWIGDWRYAFPPFVHALESYSELASRQGYVRLVTGRIRAFSDYEPVHKALNQVVQGSVADAMKLAMIEFEKECPGALLLQIHDSLVFRCLPDQRTRTIALAQDVLRRTFERYFAPVPFVSDAKPFGAFAHAQQPTV